MQPGDVVGGRFLVERLAATGGMAAVYRAREREGGAAVAIKLLRAGAPELDGERFTREAELLARLAHPGIARYLAHGQAPSGAAWLAMEWIEGEDLAHRLRRGKLTVAEAIAMATAAADALGFAHRLGLVHRDVKPSNLMLEGGDCARVKVLDFGAARPGRPPGSRPSLGMALATPAYMSPEQARGDAIDARSDVYALGGVLFECLVGHPPHSGRHAMALIAELLTRPAPPLRTLRPEVPAPLEALVARLLAKAPDDRPSDGDAVARELRAIAG